MERFPSTSEIMPQENEISVESQDELHEKPGKNKEKLKKILKKMVLWGMITGSALVGTKKEHEAGGVPGFSQGIAPETTTISALLGSKEERKAEIFYADKVVTPESIGLSLSESESTYLSSVFGEEYLNRLKLQWLDQSWYEKFEREGKKSKNTAIENFEKIELSQELLKKIWTETYPKNWIETEVDSIIFEDKVRKSAFGGLTEAEAATNYKGTTKVIFYGDAGKNLRDIDAVFAHESGHANDWETDNSLSIGERKQLLLKVTKRYLTGKNLIYTSHTVFYDESVEKSDPHYKNLMRIREYWAEICQQYFGNPEGFKNNCS